LGECVGEPTGLSVGDGAHEASFDGHGVAFDTRNADGELRGDAVGELCGDGIGEWSGVSVGDGVDDPEDGRVSSGS